MKTLPIAAIASIAVLAVPASAFAYVGPGAGLSLLGAFWALLLAVLTAVFFLVAWPVRRMLRRARGRAGRPDQHARASDQEGGKNGASPTS